MRNILFLFLMGFVSSIFANDVVEDFETWIPINTNVRIDDHWRGFLELQPRVISDSSKLGVVIVRPAIGYSFNNNLSVWGGYLMQANAVKDSPHHYDVENRVWQGLTWKDNLYPNWNYEIRNRLEQRFLPHNGDVSVRWRTRFRTEYTFVNFTPWSLIASEEFFVNLNDNPNDSQLQAGMNQNRAYVGVGYRFSPQIQVESGYLNQHVFAYSGKPDQSNNVWMTSFNLNF